MWSNAAQRNRNEAETEQSVGKAPCLTLPPPNEAKRSRKRSSDEAELPKSGPSPSQKGDYIHLITHPGQRHSSRVLCFLIITIENGAERSRIANVLLRRVGKRSTTDYQRSKTKQFHEHVFAFFEGFLLTNEAKRSIIELKCVFFTMVCPIRYRELTKTGRSKKNRRTPQRIRTWYKGFRAYGHV